MHSTFSQGLRHGSKLSSPVTGEMTQWLKVCRTRAETLSWIPSTH